MRAGQCLCWGRGARPGEGAQPTVGGPAGTVYAGGHCAWTKTPAQGGGWGEPKPGSSTAWLCPEPWCPLHGLGAGRERLGQKGPGTVGPPLVLPSARRLHKCRLCYKQLKSISGLVRSKSGLSGRHGSAFRELHLLMASLD